VTLLGRRQVPSRSRHNLSVSRGRSTKGSLDGTPPKGCQRAPCLNRRGREEPDDRSGPRLLLTPARRHFSGARGPEDSSPPLKGRLHGSGRGRCAEGRWILTTLAAKAPGAAKTTLRKFAETPVSISGVARSRTSVRLPSHGLRLYRRPGRCVPRRASERSASRVHPPTGPDSLRSSRPG
jgi:hypothetical protein